MVSAPSQFVKIDEKPNENGAYVSGEYAVVHIAARRGMQPSLCEKIASNIGITLPSPGQCSEHSGITAIAVRPGHWLLISKTIDAAYWPKKIFDATTTLASVVDVSDARTIYRSCNFAAREALARVIPIDLDPLRFPSGSAAITQAGHIGLLIWTLNGEEFFVACTRSYSIDIERWLDIILTANRKNRP